MMRFMPSAIAAAIVGLLISSSASATEPTPAAAPEGMAKATFAAGCFWCVEPPFDKLDGVLSTTSGYIDGHKKNPTYQAVSKGVTGHTEAVEVVYDPALVSYQQLLDVYWVNVDPTTNDRQFCDSGSQYRPAIFWHNPKQRELAEASAKAIDESGRFPEPIKVQLAKASVFYAAEQYHQDYYVKNPTRYQYYRWACGRDKRLKQLWGDLPDK